MKVKIKLWWIILGVLIALAAILIYLRALEDSWVKDKNGNWVKHGSPEIQDFESCADKYPVTNNLPRTCTIPKGPSFTEQVHRYVVYGDTRDGHDIHRQVINQIVDKDPEMVFHTGDLVSDGNKPELWTIFNQIVAPIRNKLYPALGNHEDNSPNYYNNFDLPNNEEWYSVPTDYAYFIVTDSNKILDQPEQLSWLKTELAVAEKSGKFVILLDHHPLFSSSKHASDEITKKLQAALLPLIEGKVNLVFSGHDHTYERLEKSGTTYVVAGSAGAPLYDVVSASPYSQLFLSKYNFVELVVAKSKLQLQAYDETGLLIDSCKLKN